MFKLVAVYRSELRFGEFGHLKNGSHSCLTRSDPQESINLHSIKNTIHKMIISLYSQDFRNVTS